MSREEAAAQLGIAPGTLKIQLERARKLLRDRLTRRGLGLSVGLLTVLLDSAETAAVSPALIASTVRAGASVAANEAIAATVSARILRLYGEASGATSGSRAAVPALLAACTLIAAGLGLLICQPAPFAPVVAEVPGSEPAGQADDGSTRDGVQVRVDAYGDPLPQEALARLGTLRFRVGGWVLGFAPDGRTLVTLDTDIQTLDLVTGKQGRVVPPGRGGAIYTAALSPDRKRLATTDREGRHLWDFASGKLLWTIAGGQHTRACFSPDGKLLATVVMNDLRRQVELRNAATGAEVWSWSTGTLPLKDIAFTPDGKTVIAAGWAYVQKPPLNDNTIRFIDVSAAKERQRIDTGTEVPDRISVSPDGTLLAAICWRESLTERHVRVWEIKGGREVITLEPPDENSSHQKYLRAVAFAPDSRSVLTSGTGNRLIEWDLATGKERRRIGQEMANCQELVFSPDGKSVVVAGPHSVIRVVDWASGEVRSSGGVNFFGVGDAAFTPDGRSVATAAGAGRISLWDLRTGKENSHFEVSRPAFVRLSPDGRSAYCFEEYDSQSGGQKGVLARDVETGQARRRIPLNFAGEKHSFRRFTPGPKELALADNSDRAVHLLEPATGKLIASLRDAEMKVDYAEFADDGRLLVAFCTDHAAYVWDVERRKRLRRIELADDPTGGLDPARRERLPYAAAVSPDGTRIVYGSQKGYVRLLYPTRSGVIRPRRSESGGS